MFACLYNILYEQNYENLETCVNNDRHEHFDITRMINNNIHYCIYLLQVLAKLFDQLH